MSNPPPPFVTYTRTVEETKVVAEVTEENIGQIAAYIKACVDYTGEEPALVIHRADQRGPWRIPVGMRISLIGGASRSVMNANGFNHDGDWTATS